MVPLSRQFKGLLHSCGIITYMTSLDFNPMQHDDRALNSIKLASPSAFLRYSHAQDHHRREYSFWFYCRYVGMKGQQFYSQRQQLSFPLTTWQVRLGYRTTHAFSRKFSHGAQKFYSHMSATTFWKPISGRRESPPGFVSPGFKEKSSLAFGLGVTHGQFHSNRWKS